MEVRRLGIEKTPDELLPKLEEIERYIAEQLSGAYLHSNSDSISSSKACGKNNYSNNTGMTDEIKNYVKSMIASQSQSQSRELVRPSQMEPGKIYRDSNLRLNDQEWLGMNDALDRLSATAGPSTLQSLIDTITKRVVDKFSSLLPKKSNGRSASKNVKVDSDEETNLTQRQLNLHIAKALKKAKKKSSQHRCSKCGRPGYNFRNCKNKKSRSKKKGTVNIVTANSSSDSDTNSSDNESNSETGSDAENTSSESDSENNFTEDDVVKIINAVNATKAKKK
jgi:hypothetical protein